MCLVRDCQGATAPCGYSSAPEFDEQLRSFDAIFHSTLNSERLLAAAEFRLPDDLNDIAIRCPVSRPEQRLDEPSQDSSSF
jgi:hypothetical protein